MKSLKTTLLTVVMLLLLAGCHQWPEYPDEPQIEFVEYQLLIDKDSIPQKGVIVFSFTDGDGDIGLDDSETEYPYDYNLFIEYFEMHDGQWKSYINDSGDTVNFNGRIPVLTPEGNDKAISGTIYDTVGINRFNDVDTVKYIVSIKDHALNESNKIEIVTRQKIY